MYSTTDILLVFRDGGENGHTVEWSPEELISRGTPISAETGEDMGYVGWMFAEEYGK